MRMHGLSRRLDMRVMFCTLCATKPTLREKNCCCCMAMRTPTPFPAYPLRVSNVVFGRIQRIKRIQLATHVEWSRYNVKHPFYSCPFSRLCMFPETHVHNHVHYLFVGASPQQTSEQQAFDIHYNQYQAYYYNQPHVYNYAVCDRERVCE